MDYSNLGLYQGSSQQMQNYTRHDGNLDDGVFADARTVIDSTPYWASGFGVAALILLFAMNRAGFRFSFGVNVGR